MKAWRCPSPEAGRWSADFFGGWTTSLCGGLLLLASTALGQGLSATDREKLGLTQLAELAGDAMPTGAGITVGQVEAPLTAGGTNYMPNASYFSNPSAQLLADTIVDKNGAGTVSTHATAVAEGIYGTNGVAPGVANVDVYNANLWIYASVLRTTNWRAPLPVTQRVVNHSWIGSFAASGNDGVATATDMLRRVDYVVNRDKVVMVAGVNNGLATPFPQVIGNAYNVISVGLTNGYSSPGPSSIDVPGRTKPDLAVPATSTSIGTGWVTGAAAMLLEMVGENSAASQPATIKAALLAGAVKTPFDLQGSTPSALDNWSHTPQQPLDLLHGAGQMNIYNSAIILASGQQAASSTEDVNLIGWDYTAVSPENVTKYFLEVPAGMVAVNFSLIATWNREIEFTQGVSYQPAKLTPSLANVDLALFAANGYEQGTLLDSSISTIDNVEHIYRTGLGAGRYEIDVTTNALANVALAWTTQLAMQGDANLDGEVDGADYTAWADNFLATNATWSQGDFNLDRKVDGADYTLWADHFVPAFAFSPVPEPSSFVLLTAGFLLLAWRGACRRPVR